MAAAVGAGLFLIPLTKDVKASDEAGRPGIAGGHVDAREPEMMSPPQKRAGLVAAAILFVAGVITLKDFLPALIWAVIFAIGLWPTFSKAAHRWPRHRHELIPMLTIAIVLLVFIIPVVMIARAAAVRRACRLALGGAGPSDRDRTARLPGRASVRREARTVVAAGAGTAGRHLGARQPCDAGRLAGDRPGGRRAGGAPAGPDRLHAARLVLPACGTPTTSSSSSASAAAAPSVPPARMSGGRSSTRSTAR